MVMNEYGVGHVDFQEAALSMKAGYFLVDLKVGPLQFGDHRLDNFLILIQDSSLQMKVLKQL